MVAKRGVKLIRMRYNDSPVKHAMCFSIGLSGNISPYKYSPDRIIRFIRGECMMRTEQLKYFVETVKQGSINKAAETIYISQSTIHDALNKLDDELDVSLLNRTHSGVTVTAEGRLFYEIASGFLDQLEDYKRIVHQVPDAFFNQQAFSLFATPEMVDTVVPEVLQVVSRKYPALQIQLQVGDFYDGLQAVREKKVDFALILIHRHILLLEEMQQLLRRWALHVVEMGQTKVMITVNRESALARRNEISIREVIKLPAVIYKTDLDPYWHKRGYADYGDMNIFFVAGSWDACDWYTSMHKDVYGFTSKASPIKAILNKKIPLKEDVYYSVVVVEREGALMDEFVNTVVKDICTRHISG